MEDVKLTRFSFWVMSTIFAVVLTGFSAWITDINVRVRKLEIEAGLTNTHITYIKDHVVRIDQKLDVLIDKRR